MFIEIGSRLKILDPSPELIKWCKENLEMTNPEYQQKARMHLWLGNTPRTLYLYEVNGNSLILPFGCLRAILPLLEGDVKKLFKEPKKVDYGGKVPLYDYQEEAVAAMLINHYGILQSPAGSGKTQMGIALACALGVKTLWLTHTKDLLTQSKSRAEQYVDSELLGTITEGKVNIGKAMTFATIQTMCKLDLDQYRDEWDCVIVDECHRVSGTPTAVTQFSKVLNTLCARHMLKNSKIHPRLAFEHCGLFVDSDLAYTLSAEYAEEQEKKAQELLEKQNTEKEDETDDSNTDKGNGAAGGNAAQARQQSGSAD